MEFAVSREGTTLITLHEGTDTTACDAAVEQLEEQLRTLSDEGAITSWSVGEAEVYEHPAAPFDPFTISVAFSITTAVDESDEEEAASQGERVIDRALEDAGVEFVTFTGSSASQATS